MSSTFEIPLSAINNLLLSLMLLNFMQLFIYQLENHLNYGY